MRFPKSIFIAMPFALLATTALSDVTADQVWDRIKNQMSVGSTSELSFDQVSRDGNALTVSSVSMTGSQPDVDFKVDIDAMRFVENGDGTVTVTMSEFIPIFIKGSDQGEEFSLQMQLRQTDASYVVSGEPELMNFETNTPKAVLTITEFLSPSPNTTITGQFEIIDAVSKYSATADMAIDGAATIGSMSFAGIVQDPSENLDMAMNGTFDGMDVTFNGAFPADLDTALPEDLLMNIDMAVKYNMENISFAASGTLPEGTMNMSYTAGPAKTDYLIRNGLIDATSTVNSLNGSVMVPQVPLPIAFDMGKMGVGIGMQFHETDAGPFKYQILLEDFSMSDALWDIFDAGQVLPRDPITIELDLTGKAGINPNFDETAQGDAMPGSIESLNLNALTLRAIGAEVLGTGAFTFDMNDMTTIPGMPKPEGNLDISIKGANGVLDALGQMGLIPQDQLMGVRMMMGMFTQPGDAPDSLKTQVEVNADGHVMVNGVRMQ